MNAIPPCIGAAMRAGLATHPDAAHEDTAGYIPAISNEQRAFAIRRLLRIRAARCFATTADLRNAEQCALARLADGATAGIALAEAERLHLPRPTRRRGPAPAA